MNDDELSLREVQFDAAMADDVYRRAGKETGYWANYFLRDLRANGGLATAKKLLLAKGTSEGFERLREERRLDLTVEALVLRHEFRPLFTTDELELARARLDRYGFQSATEEPTNDDDVPPARVQAELGALLRAVLASPPDRRMELRNDVVAFGPVATSSMRRWLRDEHLTGFAISTLEQLAASDSPATRALEEYAVRGGKDRVLAVAALYPIVGALTSLDMLASDRPGRRWHALALQELGQLAHRCRVGRQRGDAHVLGDKVPPPGGEHFVQLAAGRMMGGVRVGPRHAFLAASRHVVLTAYAIGAL